MISPQFQKIIQIELTNSCKLGCSNCTRFCSHVREPFFMDYTTFRKAVLSLQEFPGMVGITGGEATLHPDFPGYVEFLADRIGPREPLRKGREAIEDFAAYREHQLSNLQVKRGLWTSLGEQYYRNFELIQDVFEYQCINDHANRGAHQALLISRKSLGISDEEWIPLRDACWIQNLWSASVNPKGAFFCEVAAAMDMLFDGPGGWPIVPGWWRRSPEEFGDQLKWCEMCSAPLQVPRRPAMQKQDDVCPENYRRLQEIGAPSLEEDRVNVLDPEEYDAEANLCDPHAEWYLNEGDRRVRTTNTSLRLRRLEALTVCVDYGDYLAATLPGNVEHFDRYVIVTSPEDEQTRQVAEDCGAEVVVSDLFRRGGDAFNKGRMMNRGLEELELSDWVLFTDADVFLPSGLREKLERLVLNPGCLYYTTRFHLPEDSSECIEAYRSDRASVSLMPMTDPWTNCAPWGYLQLFNVRARALDGRGTKLVSEEFPSAGGVDNHFCQFWPEDKRILLPQHERAFDVVHIPHGPLGINWNGRGQPEENGWTAAGQITGNGLYLLRPWPEECYLKLTRVDRAQSVVIRQQRGRPTGFVHGTPHHGALHVGIYTPRHEVQVDWRNRGTIIVEAAHGREYTGWGLGHVMWEDNRQGYAWNGEPIAPTTFLLSFTRELPEQDRRWLEKF